jgi:hypothetical protein
MKKNKTIEASGGSTIRGLAIYGCPAGAGIAVVPHLKNLAEADVLIANPRAATASGSLPQADLPASGDWPYDNPIPGGGGSYYAFRATGTINVPTTGDYTFALGSDDGSRLRIDGSLVVTFPLPRSFADSFGTLHLAAGQHSVDWVGFQALVAAGFELSVAPAGAPLAVSAANGWNVLGDPIPVSGITLVGPLAVTVYYEGLVDDPLDNTLIEGSVITGNQGPGIDNEGGRVTVNNSTLSSNSSSGIVNSTPNSFYVNSGTLTVQNSTLSSNSSQYAGGIFNDSGGTLTIQGSTLSGNSAQYAGGGIENIGSLTVANSTLSGNVTLYSNGGGLDNNGSVSLANSTISSNSAFGVGAGLMNNFGYSIALANSIVAGNTAQPTGPDIYGFILSSDGHNLIGNADGASGYVAGDQVGNTASPLDPKLGPLQNNGDPTFTHALLPGSPAIDAGATADVLDPSGAPLTTDQRGLGFPRVLGTAADIGAFEYGTPTSSTR